MGQAQSGARNQGNQADYVLGTAEGWEAFKVVRWHGIEELSRPYRYEITLQRPMSSGAVALDKLLDAGASFRIASTDKWRVIHGVICDAEELDETSQMFLYRLVLVPHLWRAKLRKRCRNFVGKTLKEIITGTLENKSQANPTGLHGLVPLSREPIAPLLHPSFQSFEQPMGWYKWEVADEQRVTDPKCSPYICQYNESDFDFVSRLLEEEGLSYYYLHDLQGAVMIITDAPGRSQPFGEDVETYTQRRLSKAGAATSQEIVRTLREARRMRSRAVTMRVYDYNRSRWTLQDTSKDDQGDPERNGHYEYPASEDLVDDRPGFHAADIRLERLAVERELREGSSTVRTMEAGHRFKLRDGDGVRSDQELLCIRVETYATELTPEDTILDEEPFGFAQTVGPLAVGYDSRFAALSKDVPFRPAMLTPKPRIQGVQSARVTAEEHSGPDELRPVINADELARVRLRFPWDQRTDSDDGTPTSDWIRVSQYWAGAGYGALYNPRVGHEVLVAYMQGDPDRPVIVGRVYNPQNPPPYDAKKEPTKSTLKSRSAKEKAEADGFNELRFEDKKGAEQVFLHAQRNLDEVVLASHSTSVGGDQTNTVGHNQRNTVHNNREHSVDSYEKVRVGGDRTTLFESNESHTVGGDRFTEIGHDDKLVVVAFREHYVGANETIGVTGFRATTIGKNDDHHVGGFHNVLVGLTENVHVCADRWVTVDGNYGVKVGGDFGSESTNAAFRAKAAFQVESDTAVFDERSSFCVKAGGATLEMSAGKIKLDNGGGACVVLAGGVVFIHAPAGMATTVGGAKVSTIGGPVMVQAGGDINADAPNIHLNG